MRRNKIEKYRIYVYRIDREKQKDFGTGKPCISYRSVSNHDVIYKSHFDYVRIDESERQNRVKYGDIFFIFSSKRKD